VPICRVSGVSRTYWNDDARAITKKPGTRASSAMTSSASPLTISSSPRSSDMFSNGSTAIDGRSAISGGGSWPGSAAGFSPAVAGMSSVTSPTKRKPLRGMVRSSAWLLPLSPMAVRAALMRLVSVESETTRPPQTPAIRSSLLTTRSRFCSR